MMNLMSELFRWLLYAHVAEDSGQILPVLWRSIIIPGMTVLQAIECISELYVVVIQGIDVGRSSI